MTSSSSSADDYARAALRVACAQLAEAAGFASARRTALDVLSDATARYTASLGRAAKNYAEAAGRGTGNISDVLMALEDAGVTTEDLRNFIATEEELPFPHQVPNFPLKRDAGVGLAGACSSASAATAVAPPIASAAPSFAALGERPPPHVPAHFPAFPDKHTFQATPLYDGPGTGLGAVTGAGGAGPAGGGGVSRAAASAALAAAPPTRENLLAVAGRAGEDALVALSRRQGAPGVVAGGGGAGGGGVSGAVAAATAAAATETAGGATAAPLPPVPFLPLAPTPALYPVDDGIEAGAAAAAAAGAPPPSAPRAAAPLPAPPRPTDRRAAAVADAAVARAETILAAGSDAMGLEDKGE